jgi:hypothetical protein
MFALKKGFAQHNEKKNTKFRGERVSGFETKSNTSEMQQLVHKI